MRPKIAAVKNVTNLLDEVKALTTRASGMPGIGLIYGATGFGKTTAVAYVANTVNSVNLRAWPTWTPTSMLGALMEELGMKPLARVQPMVRIIVQALAMNPRPVFIDEADYIAERPILLETLRSLHDVSTAPLILIGMKDFRQAVMHRPQLAGRISQWVEFQPADIRDARTLADTVCEVGVADDLLEKLLRSSKGEMRGLTVGLGHIEHFGRRKSLKTVSASEWADQPFVLAEVGRNGAR